MLMEVGYLYFRYLDVKYKIFINNFGAQCLNEEIVRCSKYMS